MMLMVKRLKKDWGNRKGVGEEKEVGAGWGQKVGKEIIFRCCDTGTFIDNGKGASN